MLFMKLYSFILGFIFIIVFCLQQNVAVGQTFKVTEKYKNGKIKQNGKIFKFSVPILKPGISYNKIYSKKIGKWKYYFQNGSIERIEIYKNTRDTLKSVPDGIWKYWNNNGKLIKKDIYNNGNLYEAILNEISINNLVIGYIRIHKGNIDTLWIQKIQNKNDNFVLNGDFSIYKGSPILKTQNG